MAQVKLLNRVNVTQNSIEPFTPLFVNASENGYVVKLLIRNMSSSPNGTRILQKFGVSTPNETFPFATYTELDVIASTGQIPGSSVSTVSDIYVPAHTGIYAEYGDFFVTIVGLEYSADE